MHCHFYHCMWYGACSPPLPYVAIACYTHFGCTISSLRDCGVWVGWYVLLLHCCYDIRLTIMSSCSNSGVSTNRALGWGCCCVGDALGCYVICRWVRLLLPPNLFKVPCVWCVCECYVHHLSCHCWVSRAYVMCWGCYDVVLHHPSFEVWCVGEVLCCCVVGRWVRISLSPYLFYVTLYGWGMLCVCCVC